MKITYSKLVEILAQSKGALPVGILATTDTKARKTGNPYGVILKTSRSVGFVGANYEKAVRREGERQGSDNAETFVSQPRPWGEWLVPNKVATHKGKFYLRTQSTPGQRERQRAKVICYRGENGQFLSREEVKPFLPEKSYSRRQAEVGIKNEGEQMDVREFAFDSIQKLRIKGRTFELVHDSFDLLSSLYARREANEVKPGF